MKFLRRLKIKYALFIAVVISSFFLLHIVQAVSGDPGSDANPLVAQDYVDAKITEVVNKVNDISTKQNSAATAVSDLTAKVNEFTTLANNLNQQLQSLQKQQAPKFEIVSIKPGKQLVVGESTEIIVRGPGQAKVVGSDLGGLSDVTGGMDLFTGTAAPANHLLIAPRGDGRGLVSDPNNDKDLLVLVKGTYTVK